MAPGLSHAYIGNDPLPRQLRHEPETTLFDLFMGELFGKGSARSAKSHPLHLQAALIRPFEFKPHCPETAYAVRLQESEPIPFTLFFGDEKLSHTLVAAKGKTSFQGRADEEGNAILSFILPEELPLETENSEVSFYLNLSEGTTFLVDGEASNTFQLGQKVEILTSHLKITLSFSLVAGEGTFFGHLTRGNRPFQIAAKGATS